MTYVIVPEPLTAEALAPFGDVLEATGPADMLINEGMCERFHNRAMLDFGPGGRAGISIFNAKTRALPHRVNMVERHPDGSQAFIPLSPDPFLVVVAADQGGAPGTPLAFITTPGQAINLHRGIWHGVLCPLGPCGLFAVVDRIGETKNLQEHWFEDEFVVSSGQ